MEGLNKPSNIYLSVLISTVTLTLLLSIIVVKFFVTRDLKDKIFSEYLMHLTKNIFKFNENNKFKNTKNTKIQIYKKIKHNYKIIKKLLN